MTSDELSTAFEALIYPVASKYQTKPEHWIGGWDEGFSFCFPCAERKVNELLKEEPNEDYFVDGGWGSTGDSQAFCETCQQPLDNSFTDCACKQELDHFEEYGFDSTNPEDCYSMREILLATSWDGEHESSKRLRALAEKIIAEQGKEQGS